MGWGGGEGSNSLGLSNWNLIFLSAHGKCRLLPTTSGRFLPIDFRINHSGPLFSDRCLEVSGISNLLGGLTVITKLSTTRLIVAFIN